MSAKFDLVQRGGDSRDEPVSVELNGIQLAYANYDEHGSAGMEIVTDLADNLAKALQVKVRYEEQD